MLSALKPSAPNPNVQVSTVEPLLGDVLERYLAFQFYYKRVTHLLPSGSPEHPPERGILGCCPCCHAADEHTPLDTVCIDATSMKRYAKSARKANAQPGPPLIAHRIFPAKEEHGAALFPAAGDKISRGSNAFRERIERDSKAGSKENKEDNPCSQFEAAAGEASVKGHKSGVFEDQQMFGAYCRHALAAQFCFAALVIDTR